MARSLDMLSQFEEFCHEIAPALRKDLQSSLSPEEILEKYNALAAARLISIATTEKDNSKALVAIKDILDRTRGKATEKKEVQHKFEKLDEKELDAILLTEIEELSLPPGSTDDESEESE